MKSYYYLYFLGGYENKASLSFDCKMKNINGMNVLKIMWMWSDVVRAGKRQDD